VRQMADEVYELPTVDIILGSRSSRRHGGESNPITDNVEQFSIRHGLRVRGA
jgi:hypothetical protein